MHAKLSDGSRRRHAMPRLNGQGFGKHLSVQVAFEVIVIIGLGHFTSSSSTSLNAGPFLGIALEHECSLAWLPRDARHNHARCSAPNFTAT